MAVLIAFATPGVWILLERSANFARHASWALGAAGLFPMPESAELIGVQKDCEMAHEWTDAEACRDCITNVRFRDQPRRISEWLDLSRSAGHFEPPSGRTPLRLVAPNSSSVTLGVDMGSGTVSCRVVYRECRPRVSDTWSRLLSNDWYPDPVPPSDAGT